MLDEYQRRRDFSRTPEPGPAPDAPRVGPLAFTIQKHAATRLHYDVRFEVDGVLKSWPVPRAPSYDPAQKRLAVMTEDHPFAYGTFEGVIPKGEYGGGEVIVWDAGTYAPIDGDEAPNFADRAAAERRMRAGIDRGRFTVFFNGRKLKGGWTFVRTKGKKGNEWLCIKHRDAFDDPAREVALEDRSVLSGHTIEELKAGVRPPQPEGLSLVPTAASLAGARPAALPRSLAPMLPSPTGGLFANPDWVFEPKLDGYRVLATIREGHVTLISRGGNDVTAQYTNLAEGLARQPVNEAVIDGEIVVLDELGRPSFQMLQNRGSQPEVVPAFYAFDLLYLDGWDVRGVPLEARKDLLRAVLAPVTPLAYVAHFADGEALHRAVVGNGLEGIVAKRRRSLYESGKRSTAWLKIKSTRTEDLVIGGFTAGAGTRSDSLGALLVGMPTEAGGLHYVGHVGTGFNRQNLADLLPRLHKLEQTVSPFDGPLPGAGRWQNRPRGSVTWVRPDLVAEVKFAERTRDGILRQPVFLRLRTDKPAREVEPSVTVDAPAPESEPAGPGGMEETIRAALEQVRAAGEATKLTLDGHTLALTGLNKVMWPEHAGQRGLTKRDLVAYYLEVASALLPHLRDRPLTLVRYPNGLHGTRFFQKSADSAPPFVERVRYYSESNDADGSYLLCNNLPTLVWLGQMAALELHATQTRTNPEPDGHHLTTTFAGSLANIERSLLNYPDYLITDLDPYLYSGQEAAGGEPELFPEGFQRVREVAYLYREMLEDLGLKCFAKTTGKSGLHLYVPILRTLDYAGIRAIAQTLAGFVERTNPGLATTRWTVKKRTGKVFLDHNMNGRGKTLASVYSPRAVPWAGVSVPVSWDELDRAYPAEFTLATVPARLKSHGDLWANILADKRDLEGLLQTTTSLGAA